MPADAPAAAVEVVVVDVHVLVPVELDLDPHPADMHVDAELRNLQRARSRGESYTGSNWQRQDTRAARVFACTLALVHDSCMHGRARNFFLLHAEFSLHLEYIGSVAEFRFFT